MKSINMVALSGNLTRDPEKVETRGDTTLCNLGLAVNMREKKDGDWQDRASFFDVIVFGKTAGACLEYLSKGSGVIVEGDLRQDRWQNDSGDNRSKVKVVARNVVFVGGKGESESNGSSDVPADQADLPPGGAPNTDDDIPF